MPHHQQKHRPREEIERLSTGATFLGDHLHFTLGAPFFRDYLYRLPHLSTQASLSAHLSARALLSAHLSTQASLSSLHITRPLTTCYITRMHHLKLPP